MTKSASSRRAIRLVSTSLLVWTVAVLVFVSENIATDISAARPIRWFNSVQQEALYWLPFLMAAPLFAFMASRFPIEAGTSRVDRTRVLVFHALAAATFALFQPWLANAMINAAAAAQFGPNSDATLRLGASLDRSYAAQVITALWKYVVIIAGITATRYYRVTHESRVHAAQLERQLAESQLSALKAQLHPHFLFNALNSAAMLARTDPERAQMLLLQLAELFRLTLQNSSILDVPLRTELEFLDRYLGIERIRFEDRLIVHFDVAERTADLLVPSLILQPLVENSIRHGLARKRDALHLTVRSRVTDGQLVLEVQDDGGGLADGGARPAFGIGLTNVEQRLNVANRRTTPIEFEGNGSLGGGLLVRLRLPIRPGPPPSLT
jgi:two-component system, LytTR family, sensor kinase